MTEQAVIFHPTAAKTQIGSPTLTEQVRIQKTLASERGMYQADAEHDACGVGFVAHIKGQKSHSIVAQGSANFAQLGSPWCGRRGRVDGRRCGDFVANSRRVCTAKRCSSRA
jgi:hypothetical protein